MKALSLLLVLLSTSVFAEPVLLEGATVEYGALAQESNAPANEVIQVKRTTATPKRVKLKFKMNTVEKACTEYEIQFTKVDAIEQVVCSPLLNESYDCQNVTHEGYDIPKRVCAGEGLLLTANTAEIVLDFSKAIVLSEGSTEVFELNIKQKKMTSDRNKLSGRVVTSASQYKVRASGSSITFKAK